MSRAALWAPGQLQTRWPDARRMASALRSAAPALFFGLRLWAAVCLALYIAFWLELDNPYWAGTSAAIVCQPNLGASLRKGWFRMVGTAVGAVAIVVLTACFPQARIGFLLGLALWGAVCGFAATLLRNFGAYSAALAGYTAAIIASDQLGATGGANGQAFMLAITRASEICIGIVCAGVVLAGTDFGGARRRLAAQLAAISAEITGRFAGTFLLPGSDQPDTRSVRRDLVRRVIALDPVIDGALGEASDLRSHSPVLQAAVGGLFAALAGWRMASLHLELLPREQGRREAELIQRNLPQELRSASVQGEATSWMADPSHVRRVCATAVRALTALPVRTPSLRLLADQTAEALIGIQRALDALLLLADPARAIRGPRAFRLLVPDLLPAFVNAVRVFITIGAVELFWIVTAWPNGAQAVTFAAIAVILFSPRADQAYAIAMGFLLGTSLTAALAAIVNFAVLPAVATFAGFSLAIGLVLVPAGALMAQPWQAAMFTAMAANFVPLLGPANQNSYDPQQFYNSALAIVAGVGAAALAFRLLPPLSPALRTRRLLALTLRDLRRLTTGPIPQSAHGWENRTYSRLSALPEQAEPLQRGQLIAALSVGTEIVRLRHIARRFNFHIELDAALAALARGDSAVAAEDLARLDRMLAALPSTRPGVWVRLRARGSILAMSEALEQHAAYFDSGVAR
ncbi:MAG: hypothetical protein QOK29_1415 [Rhodospirillaceae bacterium]|nr:hypothetical protein [Rhodospirillaceae bacterium]